jgi:hypothetical protein
MSGTADRRPATAPSRQIFLKFRALKFSPSRKFSAWEQQALHVAFPPHKFKVLSQHQHTTSELKRTYLRCFDFAEQWVRA